MTESITLTTQWQMKSLVKQIPGARWDAQEKIWRVPAAWSSLVIMRGLFGADMIVGEKLAKWAWKLHDARIGPSIELRSALELPADAPEHELFNSWKRGDAQPTLFPFQETGVAFMLRANNGLLGDEMGA
jgi:hypothetical protein